MSFNVLWKNNDAVITCSGELITDDIISANNMLIGNFRFDNMKYQIWDFRGVTDVLIDEDTFDIIRALDKSSMVWNNNIKVGLVADVQYQKDLLEAYISLLDQMSWQTKLFDNIDDAEKWCNE